MIGHSWLAMMEEANFDTQIDFQTLRDEQAKANFNRLDFEGKKQAQFSDRMLKLHAVAESNCLTAQKFLVRCKAYGGFPGDTEPLQTNTIDRLKPKIRSSRLDSWLLH